MRELININQNWWFTKENQTSFEKHPFNDALVSEVDLPHTWNAIDGSNGYNFYKGACWYQKEILLNEEDEDKRIYVEFEGSNSITDVYINGHHCGQHRGGYSTFRFDLTDHVKFDDANLISVKVDNTVVDDVYPQMADFTFYGGIYRDVNLIKVHATHVDLEDYGSSGVYVVQEEVNHEAAKLKVRVKLANQDDVKRNVRLWVNILDDQNKVVTYGVSEVSLDIHELYTEEIDVVITHPTLWDGFNNPYLYQAQVQLTSFNDTIDEVIVPFGVRFFEVDPQKGFMLNGKHLPLNGVSRHQDRKDKGWAISYDDMIEDLNLIREVGATSIRLAHYQHNQFFYDLCDQSGFVLWAEIPFISVMSKHEHTGINAKSQMIELIRQNFNHPSIMFWGVQNEIQIGGDLDETRRLVQELNTLTKKEDPTRLTTQANVMFVPNDDPYNTYTDIIGYNKYYGWYNGKAEDFGPWIDQFHEENPHIALGISEYGAEGIIEYHNDNPKVKDYSEEYHALYHETVWSILKARPFLWSTYVWNMFDFGANIRNEGGVKGRNNKGLVTYDRKVKKDAFYLYKAHWSDEKFVHITSKRYVNREQDSLTIKVYSNVISPKLLVDGVTYEPTLVNDVIYVFEGIKFTGKLMHVVAQAHEDGVSYTDYAVFKHVKQVLQTYSAPEESGGFAANWFANPELDEVTIEPIEFKEGYCSSKMSLKALYANERAAVVIRKYLKGMEDNPMIGMMMGMTLDTMADLASDKLTPTLLYLINKELVEIKK
jgi:beta-galactosidase